ncbi:MAG TPA: hypothetical protein PLC89_11820, partial [Haliscomenobacter sp.]
YVKDKGYAKKGNPKLENVLEGKLLFMKMVKGGEDGTFMGLWRRFDHLLIELNDVRVNTSIPEEVFTEKELLKRTIKISLLPIDDGKFIQTLQHNKLIPIGVTLPYEETFENNIEENYEKPPLQHDPINTMKFLKNFKFDNDSGFKELVHGPFDVGNFDFAKVLDKVKTHPNFISTFKNTRVNEFVGMLPEGLWKKTKELIQILSTDGLEFFKQTKQHPIEGEKFIQIIQRFKKEYRFGSDKTESSILIDLIMNVAKKAKHQDSEKNIVFSFGESDQSGQFNDEQLVFLPNEKKFRLRSVFFTWVPYIQYTLSWIFKGILQHSNVNGNRIFEKESKKIEIEMNRIRDKERGLTQVQLTISDELSVLKKSPDQFFEDLLNSEPYKRYLVSIADWAIECDCDNGESYLFQILPKNDYKRLERKVNGFKHIITFYD